MSPPNKLSSLADATNIAEATYWQSLFSSIITDADNEHGYLSNIPLCFGKFLTLTPLCAHLSTKDKFPCLAQQVLFFNWVVYLFGGRHFASTIGSRNLLFQITLACNQVGPGRALFHKFTSCLHVLGKRKEMLNYIRASGDLSQIHLYLSHSLRFKDSKTTSTFWQL
jgi:hypothetical protein